jgi:membrane protein implicated in regulation of membrane protease activity
MWSIEMKTFILIVCAVVYATAVLMFFDWELLLFLTPFLVLLAFVVWNGLAYSREMDDLAEQYEREQEFTVVEKDGLTYVEPKK